MASILDLNVQWIPFSYAPGRATVVPDGQWPMTHILGRVRGEEASGVTVLLRDEYELEPGADFIGPYPYIGGKRKDRYSEQHVILTPSGVQKIIARGQGHEIIERAFADDAAAQKIYGEWEYSRVFKNSAFAVAGGEIRFWEQRPLPDAVVQQVSQGRLIAGAEGGRYFDSRMRLPLSEESARLSAVDAINVLRHHAQKLPDGVQDEGVQSTLARFGFTGGVDDLAAIKQVQNLLENPSEDPQVQEALQELLAAMQGAQEQQLGDLKEKVAAAHTALGSLLNLNQLPGAQPQQAQEAAASPRRRRGRK